MITPCKEAIDLLSQLNEISESYIIGRSLISKTSKDVDFLVFGSKKEFFKVMQIKEVQDSAKSRYPNKYISTDFPWNSLIKGKNDFFEFDILFCDFEVDIIKVLNGFPITMQHIAFKNDQFLTTQYFTGDEYLSLSPERRQKEVCKGLGAVMDKYCKYYPEANVGDSFFEALKKLAFSTDTNTDTDIGF